MQSNKTSGLRLDLARSRKQEGISLEDIADQTKISLRFLQAIENEEFDKLPGGIFSTSYLKQYAGAIGYDETELLAYYNRKMNPSSVEDRQDSSGLLNRWLKIPAEAQH
jgi:cytoskeletal protein RodZ